MWMRIADAVTSTRSSRPSPSTSCISDSTTASASTWRVSAVSAGSTGSSMLFALVQSGSSPPVAGAGLRTTIFCVALIMIKSSKPSLLTSPASTCENSTSGSTISTAVPSVGSFVSYWITPLLSGSLAKRVTTWLSTPVSTSSFRPSLLRSMSSSSVLRCRAGARARGTGRRGPCPR